MRYYELMEDRAHFIIDKMNDRLIDRYNIDTGVDITASDIVDKLLNADPTKKQIYIQWIANMYIKQQFKMEDTPQIKDDLIEFTRIKAKLTNKDIMSYKTLNDLYTALAPFKNGVLAVSDSLEKQNELKQMYSESTVLHKDSQYMLLIPNTKEASIYFGSDTKWCTARNDAHNMFTSYASEGALIILISSSNDKYQMYFNTTSGIPEIMTNLNTPINLLPLLQKYDSLYQTLVDNTNFNKYSYIDTIDFRWSCQNVFGYNKDIIEKQLIEKNDNTGDLYQIIRYTEYVRGRWSTMEHIIANDVMAAYHYALAVIKGRWLEAEKTISKSPEYAIKYAMYVIRGRWPEAEETIKQNEKCWNLYVSEFIEDRE